MTAPDSLKPVCPQCANRELRKHCDSGGTGAVCTWLVCTADKAVIRLSDMHVMGTDYYGGK